MWHGDCMVSETGDSFPAGSIIVLEPQLAAVPRDCLIALISEGATTFKQ
jgi:SOS-response transcriptional repressor LexA